MSAWEAVGSTYIEAATNALPLQRLIIFGSGFLGTLAIQAQSHKSILETLLSINLIQLTSLDSGLVAGATVANVVAGLTLAFVAWGMARILLWSVFTLAARSTSVWNQVRESRKRNLSGELLEPSQRQAAVTLLDESLQDVRKRLKAINILAEITCGFSVGCLIASYWGNCIDLITGIFGAAVAVAIQIIAVRLFLSEYFGPALLIAGLQGRPPPTPF